jgi:hypothetical protein
VVDYDIILLESPMICSAIVRVTSALQGGLCFEGLAASEFCAWEEQKGGSLSRAVASVQERWLVIRW